MEAAGLLWKHEAAPGDAFGFARVREPNRSRDRLHTHRDFAELFWIEQGRGLHLINGQTLPLREGDVVLVRPKDVHNFQPLDEAGFQFVNVTFPTDVLHYVKERYFYDVPGFYDPAEALPICQSLNAPLRRWLEDSVSALAQAPRTRREIEMFLTTFFHELFFPSTKVKLRSCPEWLRRVCEEFQKASNLAGGVQTFVELAGRSHEHVARETMLWLGKTPTELVNGARLEYAARQLSKTNLSICELALDSGFNNLAHFYRLFRARFGVTPRKFRLKNQVGFPLEGPQFPFYFQSDAPEPVRPRGKKKPD